MNYNYYTQDGHLMIEGEIMWRICCSNGDLFYRPEDVIFSQHTGYNKHHINKNPFEANHLHYFSKEEAIKQLKIRKQLHK